MLLEVHSKIDDEI